MLKELQQIYFYSSNVNKFYSISGYKLVSFQEKLIIFLDAFNNLKKKVFSLLNEITLDSFLRL